MRLKIVIKIVDMILVGYSIGENIINIMIKNINFIFLILKELLKLF